MDQFSERLTFWLFLWKWELPGLQQKVDIYSLQHLEKAKKEKERLSSFSFYLLWCSKQWIVELMLREFSIISPVMSQWTSMSTRVRQKKLFSASSVCNTGMDGERAWWVHCCQAKDIELICRTRMVDGEKQLLQSIMWNFCNPVALSWPHTFVQTHTEHTQINAIIYF